MVWPLLLENLNIGYPLLPQGPFNRPHKGLNTPILHSHRCIPTVSFQSEKHEAISTSMVAFAGYKAEQKGP